MYAPSGSPPQGEMTGAAGRKTLGGPRTPQLLAWACSSSSSPRALISGRRPWCASRCPSSLPPGGRPAVGTGRQAALSVSPPAARWRVSSRRRQGKWIEDLVAGFIITSLTTSESPILIRSARSCRQGRLGCPRRRTPSYIEGGAALAPSTFRNGVRPQTGWQLPLRRLPSHLYH
jgi:hypothetical protein